MANTNIPTSLSTSTQIPVDGKTYKNTLSEIITVDAEQAFTYYAGMIVTIAQNNKQYIWKEVEVGNTPISTPYTYPTDHIVEGFNYSNKTFGFYEYNISSNSTPEPDDRIIYRTDGANKPMPVVGHANWENIYVGKTISETDVDNYATETLHFGPIASRSLSIFRTPQPSVENSENPIWIEYYPDASGGGPVLVGPNTPFPNISDAISAGEINDGDTVIVRPGEEGLVLFSSDPIDKNITIVFPVDTTIVKPDPSLPIFSGGVGKDQAIRIPGKNNVVINNPIIGESTGGKFTLEGNGTVTSTDSAHPIFTTGKGADTSFDLTIDGINFNLNNTQLGEFDEGSSVKIKNSSIISSNTTKPLFTTKNSDFNIKASDFTLNNSGTSSVLIADIGSNVLIDNTEIKGSVDKIVTVASGTEVTAPKVSFNNSRLESLQANTLFSGIDNDLGVIAESLKINNTLLINDSVLENSVEGVKITNVVVDGELPTPPGDFTTKEYVDDQDNLLSERIDDLEEQLPVDLSAYETIANNDIKLANKANTSAVTALTNRVDNVEGNVNDLDGRVTILEGGIPPMDLQEFPTRTAANSALPNKTLFINTNNNDEENNTWYIDITIF